MSVTIKQIRYYGDGDPRNEPYGLKESNVSSGSCFVDYLPCQSMKIQGTPGLVFYTNQADSLDEGILIGETGYYTVDTEIKSLCFEGGTDPTAGGSLSQKKPFGLKNVFNIQNKIRDPYLFIELVYETNEE